MAGTVPNKPNLDRPVIDFNEQLASFRHGSCWIGDGAFGSLADVPPEVILGQTEFEGFLNSNFDELSDLGEKPGKEESKVEKLKTSNYIIEGKRTNTVELTLIGLTQERKDFLETELNDIARTIVLWSADKSNVLIFNGLRWSYERSNEFNGLYNATISTEYSGPSGDKYFIIKGIPEKSGV